MPIYQGRRPGLWRVTVYHHGRNQEWSFEGTKPEARTFEAEKRVELGARDLNHRQSPTFVDFCERVYVPHAETHLKRSTWWKVRRYQVKVLALIIGERKLTDIGPEEVDRYKRARLSAGTRASSINNELRVLGRILNYARELRYPCTDSKIKRLPMRGEPRVKVWTAAEVERIFAACATTAPEILPLLVFLANTGARKGEACAAEWSWVDEERAMLRIPSTEAWQPKDGEARDVPLSAEVLAAIPRRSPRWLFPTLAGQGRKGFPEETFRRVRRAAGVAGSPHRFRHTFASHFLAKVPDMGLLAQVLGHSDTRVTELYAHLLPGHLDRARNVVRLLPDSGATLAAKTVSKRNQSGTTQSVTSSAGKRKAVKRAVSKPKRPKKTRQS